jgi:AmmeMemoRadiSam system protein B
VQLPFLQIALDRFRIVPLLVGDAHVDDVAGALDLVWRGQETLVVVSTDLSHHHDYDTAVHLDAATANAIVSLRSDGLGPGCACGRTPVSALLQVARRRGLRCELLDLRSSGDTGGSRDRVVGYGAFALSSAGPA